MLTIVFTDDRLPGVAVRWNEGDDATFEILHEGQIVDRHRSFEAERRSISLGRVAEIAEDRLEEIVLGERVLKLAVDDAAKPC